MNQCHWHASMRVNWTHLCRPLIPSIYFIFIIIITELRGNKKPYFFYHNFSIQFRTTCVFTPLNPFIRCHFYLIAEYMHITTSQYDFKIILKQNEHKEKKIRLNATFVGFYDSGLVFFSFSQLKSQNLFYKNRSVY